MSLGLQQLGHLDDLGVYVLHQHILGKICGKLTAMAVKHSEEGNASVVIDVLLNDKSEKELKCN